MNLLVRLVACVLVLALPAEASRLAYFKLAGEGTAGLVLVDDFENKPLRAVIIDGGGGGDSGLMGVQLQKMSVFEFLEVHGYRELVVLCSHPHRDHIGGLKAATREASTFITGGKPRFDRVTFIDSTDSDRLAPEYDRARAAARAAGVKLPRASYQSAENRNAFAGMVDQSAASVRLETWKYKPQGKPHPHGRSIITIVEFLDLEQQVVFRHVDLDDADQALAERFAAAMKSRGLLLDSFTAPHHMSDRTNDISPLLALTRERDGQRPTVIATVNEGNRFDHPGPENLFRSMIGHDVQLSRDGNVVLTGKRVRGSTNQERLRRECIDRLVQARADRAEAFQQSATVPQFFTKDSWMKVNRKFPFAIRAEGQLLWIDPSGTSEERPASHESFRPPPPISAFGTYQPSRPWTRPVESWRPPPRPPPEPGFFGIFKGVRFRGR